ncbi:MAG: UDP-galactopyranose mutase [Acidiferrobacteraceae bacterium]|nr:UDP-galactopyranose mutase [Acidiferrobacteraceae bacterium]
MTKVLIIGGGFAGCCAAHVLADKGWDIHVVERLPFLGGGVRTFLYGGHPYTFGPRHFLTDDIKLFDFLNSYVPMRRIDQVQQNLTFVGDEQRFFTWPVHKDDISMMNDANKIHQELNECTSEYIDTDNFEDWVAGSIGTTLYEKFFNDYSKKMWSVDSNKELNYLHSGWEDFLGDDQKLKKMELVTGSREHYKKRISSFPIKKNGYNDYFDIATESSHVHLDTEIEEYDVEKYRVKIDGQWESYDIIISTVGPDILFRNIHGPLRWMGREFMKIILPIPQVFPNDVYFLYYATSEEPYLRIVEYKQFYQYEAPSTLLGIEFPSKKNKLYPYPTKTDVAHAQKYLDMVPERVFSIGRAGTYRYLDIDDIIAQCLDLKENV